MTSSMGGYDPSHFARLIPREAESFWFRARADLILWAVQRYFPGAQSLLEIGCGTGYVLERIHNAHPDWDLVGAELHEAGLELARDRLPGTVLLQEMNALAMDYRQEFDLVGAFDVIEHIDRDLDALRGMFNALRPGGGAVITVPQHQWLWSSTDVDAGHVRRYSRRQLRTAMEAAGFEVERITSFVSVLLPAMVMNRMGRKADHDVHGELAMSPILNSVAYSFMRLEAMFIWAGANLPVGGSLLAVGRRPEPAAQGD